MLHFRRRYVNGSVPELLRFAASRMSFYDERVSIFRALATDIENSVDLFHNDMSTVTLRLVNARMARAVYHLGLDKIEPHYEEQIRVGEAEGAGQGGQEDSVRADLECPCDSEPVVQKFLPVPSGDGGADSAT